MSIVEHRIVSRRARALLGGPRRPHLAAAPIFSGAALREGRVADVCGFPALFINMFRDFARISTEFHQNFTRVHQNFTIGAPLNKGDNRNSAFPQAARGGFLRVARFVRGHSGMPEQDPGNDNATLIITILLLTTTNDNNNNNDNDNNPGLSSHLDTTLSASCKIMQLLWAILSPCGLL